MRIFEEIQQFDQWWFKLLMLATLAITIGSLVFAYPTVAEDEMTTFMAVTIPTTIFVIVLTYVMLTLKLKTRIDEIGIHYGFLPFQPKLRTAAWHEIAHCNVKKYNPMRDYGGWGYKFSIKGRGKVYSTKGDIGIEIVFHTGKITMVGTQKPEEVRAAIHKYLENETL